MTQLSPAAARLRNEYQRKYTRDYWERKAQSQAADAILEEAEEVPEARITEDRQQRIEDLEREVKALTRRCATLSRQIAAYQKLIGDALIAAEESRRYTMHPSKINNEN